MKRLSRVCETTKATVWARRLMQRDDWVVIDLETTGLDANAELVEAAILSHSGETLLDAVVHPRTLPEPGASRVHGLYPDMLRNHVRFERIYGTLAQLLADRIVVSYNAAFDRNVLNHMCRVTAAPRIDCYWECAMIRYEQWRGFRASLATACEIESISPPPARHRALPDARLVWNLIRHMAGERP